MSDSPAPSSSARRQPPSPLIFSPETVLSPQVSTVASNNAASSSNTVSMPFVRRHVTRRLKAAKADCDKELQRVTNSITAFFEERLREGDYDTERDVRDRELVRELGRELGQEFGGRERGRDRDDSRGSGQDSGGPTTLRDPFVLQERHSVVDESSSDGGYEAEAEFMPHSRQPSSSTSMSPSSLRRQQSNKWDRRTSISPSASTITLPDAPMTRKAQGAATAAVGAPSGWGTGASSRRLSRSIHIATRPSQSEQSSRSTSRSRSPLPPLSSHASFSDFGASNNRRSSRILLDDPIDPIMTALYDLIGVATEIIDMSVAQLTAQPKVCETLVQRVQNIGKAWDDHPDWHGRNWYVQVLLAVASLSRVVEWWEAEKQFWNFDDNEDEQDEPLTFVTKYDESQHVPTPTVVKSHETDLEGFSLDDENKLRLHRPHSQNRRSRDEQPKELAISAAPSQRESPGLAPPGVPRMVSTSTASKILGNTESARVLATERLRLQAETAQNQNIVLELSLDGEHFLWVNYAWSVVVGTDPDELTGARISPLLAPPDREVFRKASAQLQEDDSKTVEIRFRLQVEPKDDMEGDGELYQLMEAKGMLMIDREDGRPSHTMWVMRPIAPPRYDNDAPFVALEAGDAAPEPASSVAATFAEIERPVAETTFPFTQPICTDPILCRICEAQIPQWYFEKHSETCAETHRLEAEISECNESIAELRNTIKELSANMDRSSPAPTPPEYRGIPIYTPSSSPIMSSPLQLFRMNKMQRFGVKKMQRRLLEQLDDILQTALEVSIPSLKEDEAREPIERQRLLSPSSERKISQIRHWGKPTVEDAALNQLVEDAERVMRQKMDNVVRMQNTIRYAEKIWHEWEERVGHMLETVDEDSGSDSGESDEEELPAGQIDEDQSSTQSEYGYGVQSATSTLVEPTPLASTSPRDIGSPQRTPPERPPSSLAMPPPAHPRSSLHTRSSTPSSISSPLALAAPIMAPSSPDLAVPPIDLDEGVAPSNLTIRTRRSTTSLLEPKVVVTPPASPQVEPRDESVTVSRSGTKHGHRRHSTAHALNCGGPLSPRQPSAPPLSRTNPTSIKDFDIIKPISKGAFGSVFLAKKKVTGDYFAIKVLKKADMIAKNQITNVKAERMILMKQAESPFVAKLYWTFQSRDNLYLVMEYLNGGDCAALIKSLGCLPEEWTKNYIAEVVLGLEYLHQRGVVHRDLKPDNLLIDQHGHLKLTDFGLSRIGLLGRQTREGAQGRPNTRYSSRSRPPSIDSAYLSSPLIYADTTSGGSYFAQRPPSVPRIGSSPHLPITDDISDSGSDVIGIPRQRYTKQQANNDSPLQSFATELTTDLRSHSSQSHGGTPPGPGEQRFVGTPDYLAPETILGLRGDDAAVDWWALGVITYEFLYGIPPFHADSPEKVFENILSGHVEWHDDWVDFSPEARDFMERLLVLNPAERLGANGADEVKNHPWFNGIEWDKVTTTEAAFIPQVTDPESTDYFDPRGAIPQLFHDDDPVAIAGNSGSGSVTDSPALEPTSMPSTHAINIAHREAASSPGSDDFGSFSFKNLPVLKQANDDVIRKLKTDQMAPMHHALSEPAAAVHGRKRSLSYRLKKPPSVVTNPDAKLPGANPVIPTNPPSPATSTSSIASSPSRASVPAGVTSSGHVRKPSDLGAVERFKLNHLEGEHRRNSMPSRLRTASVSSAGDNSGSETYTSSVGQSSAANELTNTPASSVHSIDLRRAPDPNDRVVTCLLAEDNPITAKIIETLLIRLGCRCLVVADGSEAVGVAMGDIKFDVILMDLHMPVLDGESAAKYIKSTNGKNANTPIIAVSAYAPDDTSANDTFAAFLSKPLQKADLLSAMRHIGFKTSTLQGGPNGTKVTAGRTSSS
ncbi:hypothetical protein EV121DRAFT_262171 [Schizophyllum commune]